eukprot:7885142-Prorocentrum_lima.AAC.1
MPIQLSLAFAQLEDAIMHENAERPHRAQHPPSGPPGPVATDGRDQDLFAAIATFLGVQLEDDPHAY